jgi:hypothetical protein
MDHSPDNVPNDDTNSSGLTASDRHRLLAAERRRLVLDMLAGNTDSIELGELATGIVAREDGIDAVDEATVERVAITLHHVHLPKIAQFGIIDYDPEARRIEPIEGPIDTVQRDSVDY